MSTGSSPFHRVTGIFYRSDSERSPSLPRFASPYNRNSPQCSSPPFGSPYNRNAPQRSSPLKRERSPDYPPPTDIPDRKKRVTVLSNAILSSLPPVGSRHERHQKALELAKTRDKELRLPESDTVVQLQPNELPSSPERYVHTNDHQWENHILSTIAIDNQIQTAFQVFLECFYGICGFVPYWDRKEEPSVTTAAAPTSRNNRKTAVEEYWTKFLKPNSGVYKKDLKYLEGKHSGYKDSHEYVHSMSVAAVAAGMAKYERVFLLGERRSKIYRRIWEHITGHQDYKDSMGDSRLMTPKGINTEKDDNIYGDDLSGDEGVEEAL